jgi:hypothetical protein
MDISIFLASGTVGALLFTELLKGFFDKYVTPRFQPLVTQAILFMVCVVIAGIGAAISILPANVLGVLATLFSSAIASYEILKAAIVGKKS